MLDGKNRPHRIWIWWTKKERLLIWYVTMDVLLMSVHSCMLLCVWLAYVVYLLTQSYNRDLFLFLYFLLIIVSAITSFTIHNDKSPFSGKAIMYLNRHQTEEWKGWMQVCHLTFMLVVCSSIWYMSVNASAGKYYFSFQRSIVCLLLYLPFHLLLPHCFLILVL